MSSLSHAFLNADVNAVEKLCMVCPKWKTVVPKAYPTFDHNVFSMNLLVLMKPQKELALEFFRGWVWNLLGCSDFTWLKMQRIILHGPLVSEPHACPKLEHMMGQWESKITDFKMQFSVDHAVLGMVSSMCSDIKSLGDVYSSERSEFKGLVDMLFLASGFRNAQMCLFGDYFWDFANAMLQVHAFDTDDLEFALTSKTVLPQTQIILRCAPYVIMSTIEVNKIICLRGTVVTGGNGRDYDKTLLELEQPICFRKPFIVSDLAIESKVPYGLDVIGPMKQCIVRFMDFHDCGLRGSKVDRLFLRNSLFVRSPVAVDCVNIGEVNVSSTMQNGSAASCWMSMGCGTVFKLRQVGLFKLRKQVIDTAAQVFDAMDIGPTDITSCMMQGGSHMGFIHSKEVVMVNDTGFVMEFPQIVCGGAGVLKAGVFELQSHGDNPIDNPLHTVFEERPVELASLRNKRKADLISPSDMLMMDLGVDHDSFLDELDAPSGNTMDESLGWLD